ncbi:immunity 22 family protein [Burkholderia aenigmatica]|uniref:immunity 22 family protein n=1 Tax=Burkholderia aenigmatica TaxID=2015348 RepID=UPI00264E66D9|nr:immunity 22 family protein [Burkholderia aenigmatica]MDN7880942.1 immunity 22 family protein [Burkholderia aenigmatica]
MPGIAHARIIVRLRGRSPPAISRPTRSPMIVTVHLFVSSGRFRSFAEMRAFIDEQYTEDGDGIPSAFMTEVGLRDYEPGCIEAIHRGSPVPVRQLLLGVSWESAWVHAVPADLVADSAIGVYSPNIVTTPENASLDYVGAYEFDTRTGLTPSRPA